MSIQILQYEFLGPVPFEEWGPPMEKLVYLVLSRARDKFNIIYVGDCEKTDDEAFLVKHSRYKCWAEHSGSGKSLHLAILPLFESSLEQRQHVLYKIMTRYKPVCNSADIPETKSEYIIRSKNPKPEQITCPRCGAEMKPEILADLTLFRCTRCGLDTPLNS